MRNIFKFACAALVSVSLMTSCIEEVDPTSVAVDNQIEGSLQSQQALVNGIAGYLNFASSSWINSGHYAFSYPAINHILDLMCNDIATYESDYEHFTAWIANMRLGQDYIYSQYVWTYMCSLAYNINNVFELIQPTSEQSKQWLGIAYAYRAMVRLQMGQMYEYKYTPYTDHINKGVDLIGLTIPDLREGMTEEDTRNNPRLRKEALIENIKADIAKALEYLEGYAQVNVSDPTQAVVYGLKARLHLWEEDYAAAKEAAQTAIAMSGCTPLTEAQWTDPATGFNSFDSNNSWMWASRLTTESNLVKTSLINFTSWMCPEQSFGYNGGAGCVRMADIQFYNRIPYGDFRKKSWVPLDPSRIDIQYVDGYSEENLSPLAGIKFRPGQGEPDDYITACATDYPLMRVEEMYFIIAECDAINGDASSLTSFMTSYRNPKYFCAATTPDELLEEVMFQKRVEFWGEGIIFFDYKRHNLPINRYYQGTNHNAAAQFNVSDGLAPWFNISAVRTENENNTAFVNNPDPSDTVVRYDEDGIK